MSIITVDTIIAHLKARIKAGEDCIKDIQTSCDSIRAENSAYLSVLHDIERGVLMTEEQSDNAVDKPMDETSAKFRDFIQGKRDQW